MSPKKGTKNKNKNIKSAKKVKCVFCEETIIKKKHLWEVFLNINQHFSSQKHSKIVTGF